MEPSNVDAKIRSSWELNAAAWTTSVRDRLIPSRQAGTDAAILEACLRLQPRRVLDVGCGEGWLARALVAHGIEVFGIDSTPALIHSARSVGGATHEVVDYDVLANDTSVMPGPFDAIVCNYSLFGDPLVPLLTALAKRLAPNGRLLIQTVHPWMAAGDGPYESGWREETFADFAADFPAVMPWYFRTLESWVGELRDAGLAIVCCDEPLDPLTKWPLSIIMQSVLVSDSRS